MGFIKGRGDYFPIAGYELARKYGFDGTQEEWIRMLISSRSNVHGNLEGRTASDQHPISAITGLQDKLEEKQHVLTAGANISIVDNVISATGGGGEGDTDHSTLTSRDAANQHPISAITGLQTALNGKQNTLTAGANISIVDNVISATGGGGGGNGWNTVEILPVTAGRAPSAITVTSATRQVNKDLPVEITLTDGEVWETEVICLGLHFANATELQEPVNMAGVYISDGTLQDNNYVAAYLYNTYSGSLYNSENSARLLRSRGVISKDGGYGGMYLEEIGYINNEFTNQKYIFKTNNSKSLTKVSLLYMQSSMSIETFGLVFRYRRIL